MAIPRSEIKPPLTQDRRAMRIDTEQRLLFTFTATCPNREVHGKIWQVDFSEPVPRIIATTQELLTALELMGNTAINLHTRDLHCVDELLITATAGGNFFPLVVRNHKVVLPTT